MAKVGRPMGMVPVIYTEEQIETAIDMALKGEPLQRIIDGILTSESEFHRYKLQYPEFMTRFEQARQEGLEYIADGLITAHKDEIDVQRARLKSDNAKWLLAKRKPAVYGDKVDIHVSQTIDISSALKDARSRALPLNDVTKQVIDVGLQKIEGARTRDADDDEPSE